MNELGEPGEPQDALPVAPPIASSVDTLSYERRSLKENTLDTVFAAITMAVGVGFCGLGALLMLALIPLTASARRHAEFPVTLVLSLSCGALVFFVAGVGVVRASWRIIARRHGYDAPGLFGRNDEVDSVSGCVVGLLAIVMLLVGLGVALIAAFVFVLGLPHGDPDVTMRAALWLTASAATAFVAVLLLRLRV